MGTELWHPSIKVTTKLVEKLISSQFKTLLPVIVKFIGSGWDNTVFLINNRIIFRFPHREIAETLIQRENVILNHLQKVIDLKTPNPLYIGEPSIEYPYHFHGYPIIQGKSGCYAMLSEVARSASIATLAKFLKQLHGIDEAQVRSIGADEQVFDRTNVNNAITNLVEWVDKINAYNIASINLSIFNEEVEKVKQVILPSQKVLVHGDLYCRHLLFNENELIGIIDWGDVGINSPAVDLAVLFSFYPKTCHQAFFDIYGNIDPQALKYARFLGLYAAIAIMLYGHDVNDHQLEQEAKESIFRINSSLLIQQD